jgi:CelD/BcsL family acetyltransferase involved in cellulose biosynthesis
MAHVFDFNPLSDSRWQAFVESHPHASVFHSASWLDALRRTYGYKPVALTTCSGSPLTNAIVLCEVNSWLTGSKWISLPFSDHCEPLVSDSAELPVLLEGLRERTSGKLKFAEVRPLSMEWPRESQWVPETEYFLHTIDLRAGLDELHGRLHKDSIQRKIRRADRERVVVEQGRSELLLSQFYGLMMLTRRRHGVPPQPLTWFRNLVSCFGSQLTIYVARVDERPVASILTLRHRQTLVYKYGCSDERYHNLGGTPRLFWQAIQDAKAQDLVELDLGRSDKENEGLVRFKDHLGGARTTITYRQFSDRPAHGPSGLGRALKSPVTQAVLSHLPDSLFRLAGEVLYRHAG